MNEENYNIPVGFTYKIVWIGEYRVGVVYEPESLGIDFKIHAHLLGEMMTVDHLLHLNSENIWHVWSKFDDIYMPIDDEHIIDRDPNALQKFIFAEAKESFDEVKYLEEQSHLPKEARETVEMMETLIENLIAKNPNIELESIEIIEENEPAYFFEKPQNERTKLFLSQIIQH